MATEFGSMLDDLIRERCRTLAAFCEAVESQGHKIDHGVVSKIIKGSHPVRRPPIEQIEAWSRALRLNPKEAKTFRIEALLTHTPDEIVEMVRGQMAREERHRKTLEGSRAQIVALEADVARLERLIRRPD